MEKIKQKLGAILLIAALSTFTLNSHAQDGCDDKAVGCDPFLYLHNAGGYVIRYQKCLNSIKIVTITYLGTTAPGLNFTNIVIPSFFDLENDQDIYFPGACVHWEKISWKVISRPTGPGSNTTEGYQYEYELKSCSKESCCKWMKQGDGTLSEDFGFAMESKCDEVVVTKDPFTGKECRNECFPLCSEMLKMTWGAKTGEKPITLSPNPASNFIQISSISNIVSYVIYDEIGRVVNSREVTSNLIDVSQFKKGTYFIQLNKTDGRKEAKNFQVQ